MKRNKGYLEKLNWDEECRRDFLCGRGLLITEMPFTKEVKNPNGTHSPKFNSDWGDEDAFADRYTCQCKALKGKIFNKEVCVKCNTEVQFRDVDLKVFGWCRLNRFKLISPAYYRSLRSLIGDNNLTDIIHFDKEVTIDGDLKDKVNKSPFKGIGLIEFYERYEEILVYYKDKKKDKIELYKELIYNKSAVFTSAIPIYSPVLRPVAFKGESLFFNPVDRKYNYILSLVNLLNKKTKGEDLSTYKRERQRMDIPTTLFKIQKKLMEYYDTVFIEINQKDGHKLYVTLYM